MVTRIGTSYYWHKTIVGNRPACSSWKLGRGRPSTLRKILVGRGIAVVARHPRGSGTACRASASEKVEGILTSKTGVSI